LRTATSLARLAERRGKWTRGLQCAGTNLRMVQRRPRHPGLRMHENFSNESSSEIAGGVRFCIIRLLGWLTSADPARYTSLTQHVGCSSDGPRKRYAESSRRRAQLGVRWLDLEWDKERSPMGEGPRRPRLEINRHQREVLGHRDVLTQRRLLRSQARNLAVIRQRNGNDCGPAALATVAAQHGLPLDYDSFCDQAALGSRGTDLLALSRLAEGLGFRTRGIKGSYDAMSTCTFPAIAHFRRSLAGGHFVVVHEWTAAGVVLADPGRGLRKISRRAFCRRWTGYLLLVQ
jgi:hypothetical protein